MPGEVTRMPQLRSASGEFFQIANPAAPLRRREIVWDHTISAERPEPRRLLTAFGGKLPLFATTNAKNPERRIVDYGHLRVKDGPSAAVRGAVGKKCGSKINDDPAKKSIQGGYS
jgi:hypothetical protein